MPTVRRATQNIVDLRPVTDAKVATPNFGSSGIGEGLQMLGRGLGDVNEYLQAKEDQYSDAVATEQDSFATSEKNKLLYGEGGYFTLRGKAAIDALPDLQTRFGEIDEEAKERLSGHGLAQKLYADIAAKRNQALEPRLLQHQSEQREVYLDQVDDGAINTSIDSAVSAIGDEDEIGRQIATGEGVIERKARRKGITDPVSLEGEKQLYRTKVIGAAADRLNLTDGALAAQQFVVRHAAGMDQEAATKLLTSLNADATQEWSDGSVDGYLVHTGGMLDGEPRGPVDPYAEFPIAQVGTKDRARWARRADGSKKGDGFIGLRQRPDGSVSSELSIGVEINGKEIEIPTMVPGLTSQELHWLMTTPPDQQGGKVPQSIQDKAIAHAKERMRRGLSPFKQPNEAPYDPAAGVSTSSPRPPLAALEAAVAGHESGNRDTYADGRVVTSPAGAKGRMQVMDATNLDPGYGVRPARDNSLAERARVGRDYLPAMINHYGNVTVGLTAYNSGPGKVDGWLKKYGDPRKGQITEAAWLQRLPIEESREYAPSVLARLGTRPATSGASPSTHAVPGNRDEIDLQATFDRIDADPELSFRQKEALKAAATRKHGIIKQANTEEEERVSDAAWNVVANLGDNFVSLNQLPPSLRTQLTGKQAEALNGKAEQNAVDSAYKVIEPLGDNFTDPGQIPSKIWDAIPAQQKIQLEGMAAKNGEAGLLQREVANRIATGAPLDPKNDKVRKGVDAFYLARLGPLQRSGASREDLLRFAGDFVNRVGFVPDVLQAGVRGDLASPNPENNLRGARILRAIGSRNPGALKDFSEEDISRGNAINRYVDAGLKPEEALAKADEDMRITPDQRTARGAQYEALTAKNMKDNAVKSINRAFGMDISGLTAGGAAGSQLVSDFDNLRKQEFIRTGNMEASTATALQLLRRQWGVSYVNGGAEIMKYAPELYYNPLNDPAKDAKWIREQAVDELLANTLEAPGSDIRKRLRLIPHPTVAPINGQPVYAAIIPWHDGSWHVMADDRGRAKVFMPDFATSKEAKRQAKQRADSVEAARRSRSSTFGSGPPTVNDAQLIP